MPNRPTLTLLAIACFAFTGCSSGDDTAEADGETTSTTTTTIVARTVGYGDGDTDGHALAVGDNTPKDPKGRLYLHPGDTGPDVRTLDERLDELGASIEPDELYGDDTLHLVLQFQTAQGLTPDGVVGTDTWAALDDPVATVQWEVPDIPTEHSTESPGTVPANPTTPGTAAKGDGANVGPHEPPAHDPAAAPNAWAKAVVTLSNQTATFYDGTGKVVLQAPISSGHDGLTPSGTFHVQSKQSTGHADNGVYMPWFTVFNGNIGFHSIPKTADGEDIPTPLGVAPASHGCIRMADAQAKLVFEHLPIGALVEVHP